MTILSGDLDPVETIHFGQAYVRRDIGDLSGNDGCNDYATTYEANGADISIATPAGMTRAACPRDELADQSSRYFAALEAATTWTVTDTGVLELRDEDGSLQVSYLLADG